MTDYEFGDVVLIPFPFTDQSASKKRPAVIVSSLDYHRQRPDVIVMAITSRISPSMAGDIPLQNWQAAGLLKASVIKAVVTTIEPTLILKKLGRLQEADRLALK
jgi:mRNA interferase MazF